MSGSPRIGKGLCLCSCNCLTVQFNFLFNTILRTWWSFWSYNMIFHSNVYSGLIVSMEQTYISRQFIRECNLNCDKSTPNSARRFYWIRFILRPLLVLMYRLLEVNNSWTGCFDTFWIKGQSHWFYRMG